MQIGDLLALIDGRIPFEYVGSTEPRIRGLGLKAQRQGVARTLYVLPEEEWEPEFPGILRREDRSVEAEFSAAFERKAAGVVCPPQYRSMEVLKGKNCLFVENTLDFMYVAAEAMRTTLEHQELIAVTGAAGKTTTKRMFAATLMALAPESKFQVVRGNRNVASSTLWQTSWAHGYDYNILEVSGSAFAKFQERNFALSPHVAVVTAVSEAHLDLMGDLQGVAEVKSRIFDRGPEGAVGVINADAPHADLLLNRARAGGYSPVTYGAGEGVDLRLTDYDHETGQVTASILGEKTVYKVGARGRHMALNSLAVIAGLRGLGFKDLSAAFDALAEFSALGGRGRVSEVTLESGVRVAVTDESFNSNPASIRAAMAAFSATRAGPEDRRIAILGDIAELGEASADVHRDLSDIEELRTLTEVHFFGEHMRHLYQELAAPHAYYWETLDDLIQQVIPSFQDGDHVLVKASHSSGLNAFVKSLSENSPDTEETSPAQDPPSDSPAAGSAHKPQSSPRKRWWRRFTRK